MTLTSQLRSLKLEKAILVFSLFLCSVFLGKFYYENSGRNMYFYQERMSPSLSVACGTGFRNISLEMPNAIEFFVDKKNVDLDCSELRNRLEEYDLGRVTGYQLSHKYFLYSVGYYWKLMGISWEGMGYYAGFFLALLILPCFLIIHSFTNFHIALFFSFILLVLGFHFNYIVHFRDFLKAPFILIGLSVVVKLFLGVHSKKMFFLFSGLLGLLIGIGYGFRIDVVQVIPIFAVSLVFISKSILSTTEKVMSGLISLFCFVFAALPILPQEAEYGTNKYHISLFGIIKPYEQRSHISYPGFDFGHIWRDAAITNMVNAHAFNSGYAHDNDRLASFEEKVKRNDVILPSQFPVVQDTSNYQKYSREYFFSVASHIPFQIYLKALSASQIFTEMYLAPSDPYWARRDTVDAVKGFYKGINFVKNIVRPYWKYVAATTLIVMFCFYPKKFFAFALFLSMFSGVSVVQFHPRHYFHMEIFGWLLAATLIWMCIDLAKSKKADVFFVPQPYHKLSVGCLSVLLIAYWVFASSQSWFLNSYLDQLMVAETEQIKTENERSMGVTSYRVEGFPTKDNRQYRSLMHDQIIVKFNFSKDDQFNAIPMVILYDEEGRGSDYTRRILLQRSSDPSGQLYFTFPAYYPLGFKGFQIPSNLEYSVSAVSRVTEKSVFPLQILASYYPGEKTNYTSVLDFY